eukprot:TRINITY_DN6869_c0_g2_i1.p1 TRINITY_DN6869_c0_g2~~TRINITY_DN6869_c0_g2_i1.p1  ORF type:complete len:695 (+),score=127.66 TRINITY_DN6869_c0_g2_i1:180-2087(+)
MTASSMIVNIEHCQFVLNYVLVDSSAASTGSGGGGALYIGATQTIVSQCLFMNNSAQSIRSVSAFGGGAILIPAPEGGLATLSVQIQQCNFTDNMAMASSTATFSGGGAMYIDGPINIEPGCLFLNNVPASNFVSSGSMALAIMSGSTFTENTAVVATAAILGSGGGAVYAMPQCSFVNSTSCLVVRQATESNCPGASNCGWCWSTNRAGIFVHGAIIGAQPCDIATDGAESCGAAMPWSTIAQAAVGMAAGLVLVHIVIIWLCARRTRSAELIERDKYERISDDTTSDGTSRFRQLFRWLVRNSLYISFFTKKSTNLASLIVLLTDMVADVSDPRPVIFVIGVGLCTFASFFIVGWTIGVIKGKFTSKHVLFAAFFPLLVVVSLVELACAIGTVISAARYLVLLPANVTCDALLADVGTTIEIANLASFILSAALSLSSYMFAFALLRVIRSQPDMDERGLLSAADVQRRVSLHLPHVAMLLKRVLNFGVYAMALSAYATQLQRSTSLNTLQQLPTYIMPIASVSFAWGLISFFLLMRHRRNANSSVLLQVNVVATWITFIIQALVILIVLCLLLAAYGLQLPSAGSLFMSTTLGDMASVLMLFGMLHEARHARSVSMQGVLSSPLSADSSEQQ